MTYGTIFIFILVHTPGRNFFQMTYRPVPSTAAHWDRLRGTPSYELPLPPRTGVDAAPPIPHWCRPRSAPKGRFSCPAERLRRLDVYATFMRRPRRSGVRSYLHPGRIHHTGRSIDPLCDSDEASAIIYLSTTPPPRRLDAWG
jgi:hypothetical protein